MPERSAPIRRHRGKQMKIDTLIATLRLGKGGCLVHIQTNWGETVLRARVPPVPYDPGSLMGLLNATAAVFQCPIHAVISAGWLFRDGCDEPSWAEKSDWPESPQVRVFRVGRSDGRLSLGAVSDRRVKS